MDKNQALQYATKSKTKNAFEMLKKDLPQSCCLHGRNERCVANRYVDAVGLQEALGAVEAFGTELVVAEGTK